MPEEHADHNQQQCVEGQVWRFLVIFAQTLGLYKTLRIRRTAESQDDQTDHHHHHCQTTEAEDLIL